MTMGEAAPTPNPLDADLDVGGFAIITVAGGDIALTPSAGGAVIVNSPQTINQQADGSAAGLSIQGFDDKSADYLRAYLTSSGDAWLASSGALRLLTSGYFQIMATNSSTFACGGSLFINLGQEARFRDATDGNANRVVIDMEAAPTIARVRIPEDATNSIVMGAGDDAQIGFDGSTLLVTVAGTMTLDAAFALRERSADPAEPNEGDSVIWMSDGTGKGDDGDVLIASKAGGTTRWSTLFDHSGGSAW